MNYISKINSVHFFYPIENNSLIYVVEENNGFFIKVDSCKYMIETWVDGLFELMNNQVLVRLSNGEGLIFDLSSLAYHKLENIEVSLGKGENILFYRGGLFDRVYGVYNYINKKVLFESESYLGHDIFDDHIYESNSSTLICKYIQTGEIIWSFSINNYLVSHNIVSEEKFSKPLEVRSFLGLYQETLWAVLNNGFLLGIDLESGKLKHYIGIAEDCPQEQRQLKREGIAYISQNYKLDEKTGKIILLSGTNYFEVDLNDENPVKKWRDLSQEMQKQELICEMGGNEGFKFDNQYFYFYDGPKGKVAVMDRGSFEIVWTHSLNVQTEEEFVLSLLRDLKVSEDHLYILDRNQTLHVFERSE